MSAMCKWYNCGQLHKIANARVNMFFHHIYLTVCAYTHIHVFLHNKASKCSTFSLSSDGKTIVCLKLINSVSCQSTIAPNGFIV